MQLTNKKERYLTFFLDAELYGIGIDKVKEIIAMMKITHVPKTPAFMQGVINLRGLIIPIVDTRVRFEMEHKEPDMHTTIIIIEVEKTSIGFIVDRVEEVVSLETTALSEPPKFGINIDFISKIAQAGESVIMVLDVVKLFEEDELLELERAAQNHNANTNTQGDDNELYR